MPATFSTLLALDARLVKAGIHSLTPWWKNTLRAFYDSSARSLIARVGRGGAKSHTSVKVALNEVLSGDWAIPPGEVHYWAQVSENKTEAAERFRLYEAALTALGLPYDKAGDAIIIPSLRRGIRIMACQVGSVSGFRCFGYAADEAAKWESAEKSANPAPEVVASLDAMAILYPHARSLIISSPWGVDDLHATLFERGNTADQMVAHAETWVANPSVTEQQCRDKSRGDDRIFTREYAAVPGATISAALDAVDVRAAFGGVDTPKPIRLGRTFCAIDASSLRGDGFCWRFASEHSEFGLLIGATNGIEGDELRNYSMAMIVDRIAKDCAVFSARTVFGDQRESASLESMFAAVTRNFRSFDWSETSKDLAFQTLRRLLRERRIHIEPHEKLMKEMLSCKAHLRPSGRMSYVTNGLDYLSCIVTLVHAINEDLVNPDSGAPSAPIEQPRGEDAILAGLSSLASL